MGLARAIPREIWVRAARAARLFFLIQPIISQIYDIVVAFAFTTP